MRFFGFFWCGVVVILFALPVVGEGNGYGIGYYVGCTHPNNGRGGGGGKVRWQWGRHVGRESHKSQVGGMIHPILPRPL